MALKRAVTQGGARRRGLLRATASRHACLDPTKELTATTVGISASAVRTGPDDGGPCRDDPHGGGGCSAHDPRTQYAASTPLIGQRVVPIVDVTGPIEAPRRHRGPWGPSGERWYRSAAASKLQSSKVAAVRSTPAAS